MSAKLICVQFNLHVIVRKNSQEFFLDFSKSAFRNNKSLAQNDAL